MDERLLRGNEESAEDKTAEDVAPVRVTSSRRAVVKGIGGGALAGLFMYVAAGRVSAQDDETEDETDDSDDETEDDLTDDATTADEVTDDLTGDETDDDSDDLTDDATTGDELSDDVTADDTDDDSDDITDDDTADDNPVARASGSGGRNSPRRRRGR